jgi:L-ascorbate metabolism protein UlaG (beta-lactamase superfamily)
MKAQDLVDRLTWLGHDSFRLDGPPVIYFDPWQLKGDLPPADLVLVSHDHYDHCSPDDVTKIRVPGTVIVAPAGAAAQLPGARVVQPGDQLSIKGVDIEVVHAYNVDKFRSPGQPFHPRQAGHVGYVVTVQGVRVYFAGDTDHIPEMADIRCDVAILPVSGKYVMTAEEAAEAARTLNPEIVVPMHYGSGIGTPSDGRQFARICDKEVAVLEAD